LLIPGETQWDVKREIQMIQANRYFYDTETQDVIMTLISGHGASGWEEKNPYRILVEKPLGKRPLIRPIIRQRDRKGRWVRLGIRRGGNYFRILSG
jgi:hypothetical protein